MPMHEMTWWDLVLNSSEWISVFANALFAAVTIVVIAWQVCVMKAQVRVMKWQGRNSARHEMIQNRLVRLQHEHEWLLQMNREREQLLRLGRKLHLAVSGLKEQRVISDPGVWMEVIDTADELDSRIKIFDIAALTEHDFWFHILNSYVEAVLGVVSDDSKFNRTFNLKSESPNLSTREKLKDITGQYNPTKIFLDIEAAIRLALLDFKRKWDTTLA